jgi:hypothetical protein
MNYSRLSSQELLKECVTRAGAEAWEEFVRRFQPLIAGVVARTAMRWTEVSPGLVGTGDVSEALHGRVSASAPV